MYDWQSHLDGHFKPLPGIKQYHHFRFHGDTPGICYVKCTAEDEEVAINLMTTDCNVIPQDRPVTQLPAGLDSKRQWYLHRHIRQFCREDTQDVMCPRPAVPEGPVVDAAVPTASKKRDRSDSEIVSSLEAEALPRGQGRGETVLSCGCATQSLTTLK